MIPLWFLKLALHCIDLLSWPLLALGYPVCASIQAIESDSNLNTRNLISYWILLSLIYLFEYAFHRLLQWFQYWPSIKLMIIAWLVIPDFGRAYSVYNRLIYSCISMNPQEIISMFRNSKKLFVKKENFLMQTEKYITENGTEALEKLIASKNQTAQNLDAEGMKAVPATEKNEMQQTNKVRLDVERKDIKELEMIEKKEVPESKQGNTASTTHELNVNTSSATAQIEGTAGKVIADREFLGSCASKNVQQEWTCAMCQVITKCENHLMTHLRGRKHKATFEALKAKNQQPGKMTANQQEKIEQKHIQVSKSMLSDEPRARIIEDEKNKRKSVHGNTKIKKLQKAKNQSVAMKKNNKSNEVPGKMMDIANACKQTITANQQAKMEQKHIQVSKSMLGDEPKGRTIKDEKNKSKDVHANTKVQELQKSIGTSVGMKSSILRCEVCKVKCNSESDMASHLKGRKHLAKIQLLKGS